MLRKTHQKVGDGQMSKHNIDTWITDVPPFNQINQNGDVAAHGDDQKDTVSGDGHNMAIVESHVDWQHGQINGARRLEFRVDGAAGQKQTLAFSHQTRITIAVVQTHVAHKRTRLCWTSSFGSRRPG